MKPTTKLQTLRFARRAMLDYRNFLVGSGHPGDADTINAEYCKHHMVLNRLILEQKRRARKASTPPGPRARNRLEH